jgi:hypothetical protein
MESMWSKETFCLNRISRNSPDPEMLMGGWDTLYYDFYLCVMGNSDYPRGLQMLCQYSIYSTLDQERLV